MRPVLPTRSDKAEHKVRFQAEYSGFSIAIGAKSIDEFIEFALRQWHGKLNGNIIKHLAQHFAQTQHIHTETLPLHAMHSWKIRISDFDCTGAQTLHLHLHLHRHDKILTINHVSTFAQLNHLIFVHVIYIAQPQSRLCENGGCFQSTKSLKI